MERPDFVLPDRSGVTMTASIMRALHRSPIFHLSPPRRLRISGMVAFIPRRPDAEIKQLAFARAREDKERDASDGFDGSWVAHPDLVPICQEVFDRHVGDRPNQLDVRRDDVKVTAARLLDGLGSARNAGGSRAARQR